MSTVRRRDSSDVSMPNSRAIKNSGKATLPATKMLPTMYAQTNLTLYFRASVTIRIATARKSIKTSTVTNREAGVALVSRQKVTTKSVKLCM